MNKLDYGTYDPTNADIAFASTNGYTDPASELETRKQLSYPLKELKTYINNTVTEDSLGNAVQLVATSSSLKYRSTAGGALTDINLGAKLTDIYPVGSIYLSVNNTNPSTWITGTTWEQIKDTFLLGAGDTYSGGATGGEATHTLTVDEMPAHSHSYTVYNTKLSGVNLGSSGDPWSGNTSATTGNAGGGNAHNNMPPYLVVYMWKRTA